MMKAEILTKWENDPELPGALRPELDRSLFPGIESTTDTSTGAGVLGGLITLLVEATDSATIDAIDADPRFSVIWRDA